MESARDLSGPIGGSTATGPGGNLKMSYGQTNCRRGPALSFSFIQATILSFNSTTSEKQHLSYDALFTLVFDTSIL